MVERIGFGAEEVLFRVTDGPFGVELISWGAAIRGLWAPDRDGRRVDVCLGYDTPEEYRDRDACFGAVVGRCANRIAGAAFAIDGKVYPITANEGKNTLHGGAVGFHKKRWQGEALGEDSVRFSLVSPDGEEGFPGTLRAEVTYTLRQGTLTIRYRARADKDTVVNLTNHSYFNLAGHDGGAVGDHILTLRASRYTPAGEGNIPTGEIAPVEGTVFDLRQGAELGDRMSSPVLAGSRGFDHNFVLEGGGAAAELFCPRTGIGLELTTDTEGVQLYTAGWLTPRAGKGGAVYGPGHGVCLETQHFPNAINEPAFPTSLLRAGEEYRQDTAFRFFTR